MLSDGEGTNQIDCLFVGCCPRASSTLWCWLCLPKWLDDHFFFLVRSFTGSLWSCCRTTKLLMRFSLNCQFQTGIFVIAFLVARVYHCNPPFRNYTLIVHRIHLNPISKRQYKKITPKINLYLKPWINQSTISYFNLKNKK